MKIKELWIEEYKNLKDFKINFESDNPISVFIGNNGSGKSNMLESIVLIFKYLLLDEIDIPIFKYSIKYECEGNNISIKQDALDGYKIMINDEQKDLSFLRSGYLGTRYLPDNILIYYSGFNKRMQNYTQKFDDDYRKSVEKSGNNSKRHMFYVNPDYFPLILLSMLSSDLTSVHDFLKEKFNIEKIENFSIKFKQPRWAKNSNASIDTFWGAKDGNVKTFLSNLKRNQNEIKNENTFLFSGDKLKTIREDEHIGYDRDLYKMLDATYLDDLIDNVSVTLLKTTGEKVNDYNFSEGERQLLTIRGLVEFFDYKETLYLFDEPDTFLHPKWQRDFIGEIENFIGEKNHFLITTHSPQVLSSMHENNVWTMENGKIYSIDSNGLFGRDTNSILEEVMETSEMSLKANKYIEKFSNAIAQKDVESAEKWLVNLKEHLSEKDPFYTVAEMRIDRLKRKSN
ncbi:MAG: AAA family ATPase [Bacteroidetes bacterium]|nr:AAA family ATPase [Bacteroidota bacterium]MBU1115020.1 AAA family ATPase [Bacteroidota bacterium]MBU1799512.1 AAA family ATPase [Bacteroidota bacterium]